MLPRESFEFLDSSILGGSFEQFLENSRGWITYMHNCAWNQGAIFRDYKWVFKGVGVGRRTV